jgi:hypothetical protein
MTKNDGKKDIRCAVCLGEFFSEEMIEKKVDTCPTCGTTIKPVKISQDGYIKVNWQDVRVLAIYSQRWAKGFNLDTKGNVDSKIALDNIINKLKAYKPTDGGDLDPEYQKDTTENGIPSPYYK